jgi:hypothetical protein
LYASVSFDQSTKYVEFMIAQDSKPLNVSTNLADGVLLKGRIPKIEKRCLA